MTARAAAIRILTTATILAGLAGAFLAGSAATSTGARAEWSHPLGGPYADCGYVAALNGNYCSTMKTSCDAMAAFRGGRLTGIKQNKASATCFLADTTVTFENTRPFCASGVIDVDEADGCRTHAPWLLSSGGSGGGYGTGIGGGSAGSGFGGSAFGAGSGGGGDDTPCDCPKNGAGSEPGGSPTGGGQSAAGAPMDILTANTRHAFTDYRSAGPDVLSFTRYTNSASYDGTSLGKGWSHSFSQWLGVSISNYANIYARRPNGNREWFKNRFGRNPWNPQFKLTTGKLYELASNTGYTYTTLSGTVETYDRFGTLLNIVRKNGYTRTMIYNGNGDLVGVTDSHGRVLSFIYDANGRMTSMTDPDGKVTQYDYAPIDLGGGFIMESRNLGKITYPDDDDDYPGDEPLGPDDVLLTHLDGPDGSTTATDESASAHPLTFVGTAQIDTAQSYLGGASALFDGTAASYISSPDSADWNFGAGQFTVEGWMRFSSTVDYAGLIRHWDGASDQRSWGVDWAIGQIRFIYSTGGTSASEAAITANWTPTLGVWHHIAADRDAANRLRVYVDGMVLIDTVVTATFHNSTDGVRVGQKMDGWIDEVRITKGVARYAGGLPSAASRLNNPFTTYLYEDPDHYSAITGVIDENGDRALTWSYAIDGLSATSEGAGGVNRAEIQYLGTWPVRPVVGALGKTYDYTYSLIGNWDYVTRIDRLASASTPAGTRNFTYDSNGWMTGSTNWNGVVNNYAYNTRGLRTSLTEALGTPDQRTTTTAWHAGYDVPTQIVSPERTTVMTYNANGQLLTRTVTDDTAHVVPYSTNGQTRTTTYSYNAQGLVATVDGPLPGAVDVTTYAYDAVSGDLTSTTNALGHVTQVTAHDASGRPLATLDANGVETAMTYDPRGRVLTSTHDVTGTPAMTIYAYDAAGRLTSTTGPDGATLTYEYDTAGRVIAIENMLGERIEYGYDIAGNRTGSTVKDASAAIVREANSTFDDLGRLLKSLGAYVGEETDYAWDANGNTISVTDPLSNVTGSAFDALNRLVTLTDALLNNAADYSYDLAGNRETATDQRGLVTAYVHDGFGEVIQQSSPDTGVTVFVYDTAGRRTKRTDARGVVTDWTYDDLGRPLTMTFPASPAENVAYTYDDATPGYYGIGRLASVTDDSGSTIWRYDADGNAARVETVIGAQTYIMEYAYDAANRLESVTYPSGRLVDYTYDSISRIASVSTRASAMATPVTLASGFTYEVFGDLDGLTYGNGVTLALDRDLDGRLAALDAFDGLTPVLDLDYTFNLASRITDVDDLGGGNRGRNYVYDPLYRLTEAQELAPGGTPVTLQTDYTYDAVGNRLTRNAGGSLETLAYGAFSNQLDTVTAGAAVRTIAYSSSGNTASDDDGAGTVLTHNYDSTDRLVEIKQGAATVATYLHNAGGQRVSKTIGATTTHYIYGPGGLIGEHDGTTGATQVEYVWLGGMPLAYIMGGTIYYIHADHLATPQRITDGSGAVAWDADYRPFGEATVSGALTFNFRLPGQYLDTETGMHYNYYRDYDPGLGRYIQSDPIGLAGGRNIYAYVGGNPVTRVDPRGLKIIPIAIESNYTGVVPRSEYDAQTESSPPLMLNLQGTGSKVLMANDKDDMCVLRPGYPVSKWIGLTSPSFVSNTHGDYAWYYPSRLTLFAYDTGPVRTSGSGECPLPASGTTCEPEILDWVNGPLPSNTWVGAGTPESASPVVPPKPDFYTPL